MMLFAMERKIVSELTVLNSASREGSELHLYLAAESGILCAC